MARKSIILENVSKQYRLGLVGTGTLSHDLNRWWHRVRGLDDPYSKVGVENDRAKAGGDYVWALKNIDLEVTQGDILGVIGRNGAGKSTLLKLLSGITGPTTGTIYQRGRLASLLEVGTGFHPELTGKENIFLNGAILGMTKAEIRSKIDEIVEFSGCAKYIDTPVKRYSSGMRVRLGFAVAAFLEPEILIVDEVLAVGDAEFQKKAIGKMQDVSKSGERTVLFVSHNMTSIKKLCKTGIVLDNGQIKKRGTAGECIEYYISSSSSELDMGQSAAGLGNADVEIQYFRVQNNKDGRICNSREIKIEYAFLYKNQNTSLGSTIEIRTLDEIVVIHQGVELSSNMDSKAGVYHVEFTLPAELLNAGKYKINLVIGENKRYVKFYREGIAGMVVEDCETELIRQYPGMLKGLMKTSFKYSK